MNYEIRNKAIRKSIEDDWYYLSDNVGRIIHFDRFSVVRYDGSTLRRNNATEWVLFNDRGEEVDGFDTLREAKEYGERKTK